MRAEHLIAPIALALAIGCGSDEKKPDPPPAPAAPVAPASAPSPSPAAAEPLTIKGSKKPAPPPPERSKLDQQRIDELKNKAKSSERRDDQNGMGSLPPQGDDARARPRAPGEWRAIDDADGAFQISFPADPARKQQTIQTTSGPLAMHSYSLELADKRRNFFVAWNDFPPAVMAGGTTDQILDGASNGGVIAAKGRVVETRPMTIDGAPGREVRMDIANGQGVIIVRFALSGNRLYQAGVAFAKSDPASHDVATFLDSLRITRGR